MSKIVPIAPDLIQDVEPELVQNDTIVPEIDTIIKRPVGRPRKNVN